MSLEWTDLGMVGLKTYIYIIATVNEDSYEEKCSRVVSEGLLSLRVEAGQFLGSWPVVINIWFVLQNPNKSP